MPEEKIDDTYLWGRLEPLLGYLEEEQRGKVREALNLAYDSHCGQKRKSGEPYITHPVEVRYFIVNRTDTQWAGLRRAPARWPACWRS